MPTAQAAPLTPAFVRRRRRIRRVVASLVLLCLLALGGAFAGRLWLRHAIASGVPHLDGTLRLPGLSAPVTVRRDSFGVPNIQAANEDDLLRAQGFVTAQDRLWQMDMLRRHAAGELAEVLGSSMLDHDKTQRVLQLRAVADRSVATLAPAERHALEQYSAGVNAAIAASDPLPAEFRLLGYTPRPWTPRDSLLVGFAMAEDLSTSYPNKLNREAVAAHLTADEVADLYPATTFRDHPPAEGHKDLSAPREMIEIPLDPSQVRHTLPNFQTPGGTTNDRFSGTTTLASNPGTPEHLRDLLHSTAVLAGSVSALRCDGCAAGSNNWVVSGARSASGKPLLANDMHLRLSVPGIWYAAALSAPGMQVSGVTLPGVPYVVVGHNAHVAWGFTNSTADVQDLYIEQRSGDTVRAADGSTQTLEHHTEVIHVKHGLDTTVDVALSRHGEALTPILSPLLPHETRTVALRWTLYEPGFASVPFGAANRAESGTALEQAFAHFGGPSQNLVWGDDGGHIGYHLIGLVPLRARNGSSVTAASALQSAPDNSQLATGNAQPGADPAQPTTVTLPLPQEPGDTQNTGTTPAIPLLPADTAPATTPAPSGNFVLAGTPVPTGTAEWTGFIPYDRLPLVTDPTSGVLATANSRITADSYPYPISQDWESPYRNERIWQALGDRTGLTPADMTTLQNDVFSAGDQTLGQRIAYAVDHAQNPGKQLRGAADLLRGWDGRVTPNAPQPNITEAVRTALFSMLLEPKLGKEGAALYTARSRSYALEMLVEHADSRWLPSGYTSWNTLLTAALERGLKDRNAPSKLASWRWDKSHELVLEHPVFGRNWWLRALSGAQASRAALPGNAYTVHVSSGLHSASERLVVDLASPGEATLTLPLGESGHLASPHFADQFAAWVAGRPLPGTEVSAAHRLTLTP